MPSAMWPWWSTSERYTYLYVVSIRTRPYCGVVSEKTWDSAYDGSKS